MPYAEWKGQSIFYLEVAPPHHEGTILCLHGAGGRSRHFAYQLSLAQELNRRVIALDLPGHGHSGGKPLPTIDDYAGFVQDFIVRLALSPVSFIGHSMGSAVALTVAAANPALVKDLVLIGTAKQFKVAPWLLESLEKGERPLSFVELAYHKGIDPKILAQAKEEFTQTPVEVLLTDFLACRAFTFEPAGPLSSDCLLLFGEEDRLTPVKYVQPLRDLLPRHRLSLIPDAGHMVMIEQPESTNREICNFLSAARP